MRQSGSVQVATGFGPHDHICWVHEGEDRWRAGAVSYLDEGARAGDRLLYVADKSVEDLIEDLVGLPGRDAMLESGQLLVESVAGAYGGTVGFTAHGQIATFQRTAHAAVAAGYRGLRLAAEATALARTPEQGRRFAAYELNVDAMVAETPLLALCGYDAGLVPGEAQDALAFVHPLRRRADRRDRSGLHAAAADRWRLHGEVDLADRAQLDAALDALPTDADLHLDLGGLRFIDVAGAAGLVALARRMDPGRRLVLHRPPGVLETILGAGWPELPDALQISPDETSGRGEDDLQAGDR